LEEHSRKCCRALNNPRVNIEQRRKRSYNQLAAPQSEAKIKTEKNQKLGAAVMLAQYAASNTVCLTKIEQRFTIEKAQKCFYKNFFRELRP